jgi:hypothetical protein
MTSPITPAISAAVTALPSTVANGQPGELADTETVYRAVKALLAAIPNASLLTEGQLPTGRIAPKAITQDLLADEVVAQLGGGGGGGTTLMTGRRVAADSTLGLADNYKIVEADSATAMSVNIGLDLNDNYPTAEFVSEVSQVGAGQVTVKSAIPVATSMQRVDAPSGTKTRARGSSIGVRRRPLANIPQTTLPTTGLRGWWDADTLAGASGSAVASWSETSGAGLPALVQTVAANQPTIQVGANGHKGVYFAGNTALQFLSFTGTALDLARNKSNLMVLIVYSTPFGITGDRTLLSMSVGGDATRSRVLMQQRDAAAGNMVVGGRRTDAEASGQYTNSGPAVYPDIAVFGAQFDWAAATCTATKNNAVVNTLTGFQTAGVTSDTRSAAASLGANAPGTLQGYLGTVYGIGFWDNSATVRAAFQTYAEARWGSQWIIGGDAVA